MRADRKTKVTQEQNRLEKDALPRRHETLLNCVVYSDLNLYNIKITRASQLKRENNNSLKKNTIYY